METNKPIQGYSATKDTGYQAGFTLPTTETSPTPVIPSNNTSPTIVSNANVKTKVNQDINKFNQLGQPYNTATVKNYQDNQDGTTTNYLSDGSTSRVRYNQQANGSLQPYEVDGQNQQAIQQSYYTPEAQTAMQGFDNLQKNSDDLTKQYLEQAKEKYRLLNEEQRTANSRVENNVRGMLAMGGSNASGSDSNSLLNQTILEGQRNLSKLANQEQGVYLEALKAQKDENYKLFSDKVSQLDVIRNAKIQDAIKYNDNITKQAEKIQEEKKQADKEMAVQDIYSQGVTDPASIVKQLRTRGISIPLKTVADTTALLSGVGGIGVIGEYNFAKSQGYKGTFSEYQDEDANRKIKVTAASQNPERLLTATEAQALNVPFGTTASQAYGKTVTKPPTAAQTKDALYAKRVVDANPTIDNLSSEITKMNAATYAYYKTLEDTSIGNAFVPDVVKQIRQAQRNFATAVLRRESGASISASEFDTLEKQYFPRPGDDDKTLAQKAQNRLTAQKELIRASGAAYGAEESTPTIGQQSAEQIKQAETNFDNLMKAPSPSTIKYFQALREEFGRVPTAAEYFERFPEEMPKTQAFNTVVGDTNPAKGIVGGINLNGYAVDPNQIKSVATIYDKVPESGDALDFDMYIKSVAPKSKITGQDILNAANVYQLDPKAILALMQHESRIGTSSVALANNNFGGITWSPSYAKNNPGAMKGTPRPANEGGYYVKFATPEAGLMAQAQLLSKRKIA